MHTPNQLAEIKAQTDRRMAELSAVVYTDAQLADWERFQEQEAEAERLIDLGVPVPKAEYSKLTGKEMGV